MPKSQLRLIIPATVNRTVTPKRRPNSELRTRGYSTQGEVEALLAAAKGNRWGHRDATMLLVAYRHGLRAAELVDLRWDQVDFQAATLHVRRVKRGTSATTPDPGRRAARPPTASARAGREKPIRLHLGERRAV
jgi:integrase